MGFLDGCVIRRHTDDCLESVAIYSPCERYRYALLRRNVGGGPMLGVTMLNPSTATEAVNDPTVAWVQRWAARNWFCGLVVTNLFAFRATDPRRLRKYDDPVGPHNDEAIRWALEQCKTVVFAWGNHGRYRGRDAAVVRIAGEVGCQPQAWKVNKDGSPAHPLYLPAGVELRPFAWKEAGGA